MEKLITLAVRKPELSLEEFRDRYLHGHAMLVQQHVPALARYIVNVVDVPPEVSGYDAQIGSGDSTFDPRGHVTRGRPYDAVIETWFESLEDFTDPARAWDSEDGARAVRENGDALVASEHVYHIDETIQKQYERDWPDGERSPGIKSVFPVNRTEWMDGAQFADHWHHSHGPLAVKHHIGLSKYVQNVVVAALSEGAPWYDGFAELHYRTAEDLRERHVDSPEGAEIIAEDSSKFVGAAIRLDSSEYILIG